MSITAARVQLEGAKTRVCQGASQPTRVFTGVTHGAGAGSHLRAPYRDP